MVPTVIEQLDACVRFCSTSRSGDQAEARPAGGSVKRTVLCLVPAMLLASPGPAVGASAAAPAVSLVGDTLLDPSALYFVSYDGVVNNNSFQQDAILTYQGRQYATWYTASRNAVV